ncbi:MAG: ComEA family DNA-binding protein [Phycisphaerae bacterium]
MEVGQKGSVSTTSLLANPGTLPAVASAQVESKIDPNAAAWAELASLPGIGEVLAKRIVEYRQGKAGGPNKVVFRQPEDLEAVRGIGPKTVAKLAKHLKFPQPATAPGR